MTKLAVKRKGILADLIPGVFDSDWMKFILYRSSYNGGASSSSAVSGSKCFIRPRTNASNL
jgi:hypothetical protein